MSATTAEQATETTAINQAALLDFLLAKLCLKNDAALARALEVAPPVISKIRHGALAVGATILIAMHELTELSVADLRGVMGDRRAKFRSGVDADVRAAA